MRLEPGTSLGPSVPHPFLYGFSKMRLTHEIAAIASRTWKAGRSGMVISCVRLLLQSFSRYLIEIQITISLYTSPSPPETSTTDVQEDTLETLVKAGAGGFSLGSLIGKGSKFGGLDIKRVYFGYVLVWFPSRAPALYLLLAFFAMASFRRTRRSGERDRLD